jgi:hypothetical protein
VKAASVKAAAKAKKKQAQQRDNHQNDFANDLRQAFTHGLRNGIIRERLDDIPRHETATPQTIQLTAKDE